tara:strand:- start:432 stop:752 length:321 start_codon:yes stop_codon:yes gene_type:complete
MKIILNLIILNLMQMILTLATILLLSSCARGPETPQWILALETLPQVEGFSRAGVFTINKKLYVQYCDPEGNQIWMRHDAFANKWRQSRYNTDGCTNGDKAGGPEE